MPLAYDPEYFEVFKPLIPLLSNRPKTDDNDIPGTRAMRNAGLTAFFSKLPACPEVKQNYYVAKSNDGYEIPITSFSKERESSEPGPAILHFHGGGFTVGTAEIFGPDVANYVNRTSVPFYSVDYRLAPEFQGTTAAEDGYAALLWLHEHAEELNIDPARIGIYGDSAGCGVAVGVVLMARDRKLQPPLARQILNQPMLDDRNTVVNEELDKMAFWTYQNNRTGWKALLGDQAGNPEADISPYAAPGRAKDLSGLPPAYIDIGEIDIFREEALKYALDLLANNISVEFHLHSGVPHAFGVIAPNISVTMRAVDNKVRVIKTL